MKIVILDDGTKAYQFTEDEQAIRKEFESSFLGPDDANILMEALLAAIQKRRMVTYDWWDQIRKKIMEIDPDFHELHGDLSYSWVNQRIIPQARK